MSVCVYISNYHDVHFKYLTTLYVNYATAKLKFKKMYGVTWKMCPIVRRNQPFRYQNISKLMVKIYSVSEYLQIHQWDAIER